MARLRDMGLAISARVSVSEDQLEDENNQRDQDLLALWLLPQHCPRLRPPDKLPRPRRRSAR